MATTTTGSIHTIYTKSFLFHLFYSIFFRLASLYLGRVIAAVFWLHVTYAYTHLLDDNNAIYGIYYLK